MRSCIRPASYGRSVCALFVVAFFLFSMGNVVFAGGVALPVITVNSAQYLSSSSATLSANITGSDYDMLDIKFKYGTDPSNLSLSGTTTPNSLSAGAKETIAVLDLRSLTAATTYYYVLSYDYNGSTYTTESSSFRTASDPGGSGSSVPLGTTGHLGLMLVLLAGLGLWAGRTRRGRSSLRG